VVLTGNCHSQQAVIAGVGSGGLGLVWMDCHADFHTPETTESGYFDGYGLAMVVGDCWQTLCATVPGFVALREENVVLVGVREPVRGSARAHPGRAHRSRQHGGPGPGAGRPDPLCV